MKIKIFVDSPFCFLPYDAETEEFIFVPQSSPNCLSFEDANDLRAWAKANGHEIVRSLWFGLDNPFPL